MAKSTAAYYTKLARASGVKFTQGVDTFSTYKTIFTPGTDGSIIEALAITTTDTVANAILLAIYDGSTYHELGHISVPASSGRGTVNAVSGMNRGNLPWLQVDANGNPVIKIESGYTLQAKLNADYTTASSYFYITALGGDF
jgi:hypothetical protein